MTNSSHRLNSKQGFLKSVDNYFKQHAIIALQESEKKFINELNLTTSICIILRYILRISATLPHTIHYSSNFRKNMESVSDQKIKTKINKLLIKLKSGSNDLLNHKLCKEERFVTANSIGYFDSKGNIVSDFLLDSLHIMHFHVGYNKITNDNLVFALLYNENAYILGIGSHKDLYFESSGNIIIETLINEFQEIATKLIPTLKGNILAPSRHIPTPDIIKNLKIAGVNPAIVDRSHKLRFPINSTSTARTPIQSTMLANNIFKEASLIFNEINSEENQKIELTSLEHRDSHPCMLIRSTEGQKAIYTIIKLNSKSKMSQAVDIIHKFSILSETPIKNAIQTINKRVAKKRQTKSK